MVTILKKTIEGLGKLNIYWISNYLLYIFYQVTNYIVLIPLYTYYTTSLLNLPENIIWKQSIASYTLQLNVHIESLTVYKMLSLDHVLHLI